LIDCSCTDCITLVYYSGVRSVPSTSINQTEVDQPTHIMKRFLSILLCLSLVHSSVSHLNAEATVRAMKAHQSITQSITPGVTLLNVSRPEGERHFYVYASPSYINSTEKLPLLMTYHGLGDNCHSFLGETGFMDPAASDQPFLLVVPCATAGLIGNAWNAGTCCLQPTKVDDIAFTEAIFTELSQAGYTYDPKHVFAAGFSNGAMLSEVIGCQLSDIVRGVASVSGVVELEPGNDSGLNKCDEMFTKVNNSLAVFHVHGLKDPIVPFDGDVLLGFPAVEKDLTRWSARVGCDAQSVPNWTNGTFSSTLWPCKQRAGSSIELVTNSVGVHEWPSTAQFDTTTAIVDWMHRVVAQDAVGVQPKLATE